MRYVACCDVVGVEEDGVELGFWVRYRVVVWDGMGWDGVVWCVVRHRMVWRAMVLEWSGMGWYWVVNDGMMWRGV